MGGDDKQSEASRIVHSAGGERKLVRTVGPPIQRGSTVLMPNAASLYDHDQPTYGRAGLATQEALREALAELEGAGDVRLFPSGLAAITGALLAVLKAGDEILVVDSVYAPVRRFCDKVLKRFGIAVNYYPPRTTPEAIFALGGARLRLVLLESPGSLTFEIQDVAAIAAIARQRGVLTLVDNTWAAGLLFKPLACGVDISAQALTKYVCGHADVFMGSAAAGSPAMARALEDAVWHIGWSVSPDDAYQALRGLRTLPVRMERHGRSGMAVAEWLKTQAEVVEVLHPAMADSPDHQLWRRDFSGANGLFGIVLRPAPEAAVDAFLDTLKLFGLGFSWGGFESLAISADSQLDQRRERPQFGGPLLRLHVGLEDPADLIADLRGALDAFAVAMS